MGTILCQDCSNVIAHFESNKVATLYGKCPHCKHK